VESRSVSGLRIGFPQLSVTAAPHDYCRSPAHRATANSPELARCRHVLVVDDNARMRAYLAHSLLQYWTVATAADGQAVLDTSDLGGPIAS
jgi:PleD family two-component response regulator